MSTESHALSFLLAYHVSLSFSCEVLGFTDVVTFSFGNINLSLLCWPALVLACHLIVVVEVWVNMNHFFFSWKHWMWEILVWCSVQKHLYLNTLNLGNAYRDSVHNHFYSCIPSKIPNSSNLSMLFNCVWYIYNAVMSQTVVLNGSLIVGVEVERIWLKQAWHTERYCPGICLDELSTTTIPEPG